MISKEWERALMPDKPSDAALLSTQPMVVMRDSIDPSMERHIPNPYHTDIARIGSFKQFLMDHFHDAYVGYIRDLIERGSLGIGKRSKDELTARRMSNASEALEQLSPAVTVWDEGMVRQLINMVKVMSATKIIVYFHGGLMIEQEMDN